MEEQFTLNNPVPEDNSFAEAISAVSAVQHEAKTQPVAEAQYETETQPEADTRAEAEASAYTRASDIQKRRFNNSLQVGLLLLLCTAVLAVEAITSTGMFRNRNSSPANTPAAVAVDLSDEAEPVGPDADVIVPLGSDSETVLIEEPGTDIGTQTAVTVPDSSGISGEGSSAGSSRDILTRISALGEVDELQPNFSAYDPGKRYKIFDIIPIFTHSWYMDGYELTLTGISGSTVEPYLLFDVRIDDPYLAEQVTDVEIRMYMIGTEMYVLAKQSYTNFWESECTKDPDEPGLYHIVSRASTWVSSNDNFVLETCGLVLHAGDISYTYDFNIQSVLHVDSDLFTASPQLYSGSDKSDIRRYKDLNWYSSILYCYSDNTLVHIDFTGALGTDARLTDSTWSEFASKLKLVVNGTVFDPIPGSAGSVEHRSGGVDYSRIAFPAMEQIHSTDTAYLMVDDIILPYHTEWLDY